MGQFCAAENACAGDSLILRRMIFTHIPYPRGFRITALKARLASLANRVKITCPTSKALHGTWLLLLQHNLLGKRLGSELLKAVDMKIVEISPGQ